MNVERRAKKEAVKCVMIADSSFHMQSAPLFPCAALSRAGRLLRILINSAGGAGSLTSISGIPSEPADNVKTIMHPEKKKKIIVKLDWVPF